MKKVQVVSIQHQQFPLETIGKFHLDSSKWEYALTEAKKISGCDEIMYLNTCNRVEWVFTLDHYVCPGLTAKMISLFCESPDEDLIRQVAQDCIRLSGEEAVLHCIQTASSLNSAVIGEHEILGQMRAAYAFSEEHHFAKDGLRILMKQCIKTSKQVFSQTDLRRKPVSIVSIAWNALEQNTLSKEAHIGLIGAGQIIGNFAKFLRDAGFVNVHVFNRSQLRAQQVASWFTQGSSHDLNELDQSVFSMDVWVVCTAATDHLLQVQHIDLNKPVFVIDLALPSNVHPAVSELKNVQFFDMKNIQTITSENIAFRNLALEQCHPLVMTGMEEYKSLEQERKVELAMQNIPTTIKEIKEHALGIVFQKEYDSLDEHSKKVIQDILGYMEKKYISVPMKMAKAVLLEQYQKN